MRKKIVFFGLSGVLVSGAAIGGTVAATYIWKKQTTKTGTFSWAPNVLQSAKDAQIGSDKYDKQVNMLGRYFEYKSKGVNHVFSSFDKLATFLNYQSFTSGFNVSTSTGNEFYGGFDSLKKIGISTNVNADLNKDFTPFDGKVSNQGDRGDAKNVASQVKIGADTFYIVNKSEAVKLKTPSWFNVKETIKDENSLPSSNSQFDLNQQYYYKTGSASTLYTSEDELLKTGSTINTDGYPSENFGEVILDSTSSSTLNGKYKFFPASASNNPAYSPGVTPQSVDLINNSTAKKIITVDGIKYTYLNDSDFSDYKPGINFKVISKYEQNIPSQGGGWLMASEVSASVNKISSGGFYSSLNRVEENDDEKFAQGLGQYADPREMTSISSFSNTPAGADVSRWTGATKTPPGYSFLLNGKPFHYYDPYKGGARQWYFGKGVLGTPNTAIQSDLWYNHGGSIPASSPNKMTLKPVLGLNDKQTWEDGSSPSDASWQNKWVAQYPLFSIISTDITAFRITYVDPSDHNLFKIEKVDPNDNYNEFYFFGNSPAGYGASGYNTPTYSTWTEESQYLPIKSNISSWVSPIPGMYAFLSKDNISKDYDKIVPQKYSMFRKDANGVPEFDTQTIATSIKITGTTTTKANGYSQVLPDYDRLNYATNNSTANNAGGGGVWSLISNTSSLISAGWQIAPVANHPPGWYRVTDTSTSTSFTTTLLDGSTEGSTGGKAYETLSDDPVLLEKFQNAYPVMKPFPLKDTYVTVKTNTATGYEAPSAAVSGWFREDKTSGSYIKKALAFGEWKDPSGGQITLYDIIENSIPTYYEDRNEVLTTKLKIQSVTKQFIPDQTLTYEVHDNSTAPAKIESFKWVETAQPKLFDPLPGTTVIPSYLVDGTWDGTLADLPLHQKDIAWFRSLLIYNPDLIPDSGDEQFFQSEQDLYKAAKISPIQVAAGEKIYTDSHNEVISETADENTLLNYGIGIFREKDLKVIGISGADVIFIDNVEYHPLFE